MKRIALIVLLALLISSFAFVPAQAHEGDHCADEGKPGASEFGKHISDHGKERHFSGDDNPGVHHKGNSSCKS